MKWTVTYSPDAQNDLVEIWLYTTDKQSVAKAADEIDRLLASDPLIVGESHSGFTRIICERPLAVQYDVYQDDLMVIVVAVRHGRRDQR